jgi:hypothetical protein
VSPALALAATPPAKAVALPRVRTGTIVTDRHGSHLSVRTAATWMDGVIGTSVAQRVAMARLAAKLRPGNVHSAEGWDEVLLPLIDRSCARVRRSSSARTRRLPSPPSMRPWNVAGCGTRSACRPISYWSGASRICSPGPAAARATRRWSATAASSIRRPRGTARAA